MAEIHKNISYCTNPRALQNLIQQVMKITTPSKLDNKDGKIPLDSRPIRRSFCPRCKIYGQLNKNPYATITYDADGTPKTVEITAECIGEP